MNNKKILIQNFKYTGKKYNQYTYLNLNNLIKNDNFELKNVLFNEDSNNTQLMYTPDNLNIYINFG